MEINLRRAAAETLQELRLMGFKPETSYKGCDACITLHRIAQVDRIEQNTKLCRRVAEIRIVALVQSLEELDDYGLLDVFLKDNKENVAKLQEFLKGKRG